MIARLTLTAATLHRERRSLAGSADVVLSGDALACAPAAALLGREVILCAVPSYPRSARQDLLAMAEACEILCVQPISVELRSVSYEDRPSVLIDINDFERLVDVEHGFSLERRAPIGTHLASVINGIVFTALVPRSAEARWYARSLGCYGDAVTVEQDREGVWYWSAEGPERESGTHTGYDSRQSAEEAAVRWLRDPGGAL